MLHWNHRLTNLIGPNLMRVWVLICTTTVMYFSSWFWCFFGIVVWRIWLVRIWWGFWFWRRRIRSGHLPSRMWGGPLWEHLLTKREEIGFGGAAHWGEEGPGSVEEGQVRERERERKRERERETDTQTNKETRSLVARRLVSAFPVMNFSFFGALPPHFQLRSQKHVTDRWTNGPAVYRIYEHTIF